MASSRASGPGHLFEERRKDCDHAVGRSGLSPSNPQSRRFYREALQAFRSLGIVPAQIQTSIEMATVLDPTLPEVADAIASARELLTRLGAKAYLVQLDAATDRPRLGADLDQARSPDPSTV